METNTFGNTIGTLDIIVLSCFLVVNVVLGFISRKKCWDVKETVFGKTSKFSNFTLVTTLCATMIEPTFVINNVQQINIKGLPILIMSLVMYPAMYFIITFWLVPRVAVTNMSFSWYEYIGEIYGTPIRVIYSLCNLILSIGWIAELLFTMSTIIHVVLGCPLEFAKIIGIFCGIILIFYSAYGGLRAVTITDIFQFFLFFTIIVALSFSFWVHSPEQVHINFGNLFDGNNPKMTWKACFGSFEITIATLSFWFLRLIPDFPQEIYQRCYASKSLKLSIKNMLLASILFLIFAGVVDFIALQIMASNNNLKINEVIPFFVNSFSSPGVRGLFCAAILSISISTIDSCLNASAIVLGNDVLVPLRKISLSSALIRRLTFVVGFAAMAMSYFAKSIFDILQSVGELVFPVNCFTFLAIILGVRTHKNVIYISMFTGIAPIIIYHMCGFSNYGFFLGAAGNFFGFLISHLIWKKYFRSNDPNMYYNKKDSFKRLKDFEYDDDLMSYTEYKLKSGEWKEDLEETLKKQNEENENAELQKRFHAIVKERMRSVVEEYDREKAEDEAYNRSLQEKKAQDYDLSIYKEKDATKDFYELKDLPETCAAYGIVKKAGHKMCRQDILNQYINESWQWKRNHPEDLNGPNNIYNDSIPVPEKIFGIKIMPKKEEKNEDPMQNITVDDFVDLRKRFKKAVKEKMEEMGLKYVPDIEDELELMKNEQENEQKIVKKYKELWLEEIRKEQEEEKKNKKKKK